MKLPRRASVKLELAHSIADAAVPAYRKATERAFRTAVRVVNLKELERAYQVSGPAVQGVFPWHDVERILADTFVRETTRVLRESALRHEATIPGTAITKAKGEKETRLGQAGFRFDLSNPRALRWITYHANVAALGISDEAQRALATILRRMYAEGLSPSAAAPMIREVVGLNQRYAIAVANYRAELVRQGMEETRVAELGERYAERLRQSRALTIARTETMTAANEGQRELWRQAAETGLLDSDRTRVRWMVAEDERLCVICAPMQGHPGVRIHENFPIPGPAAHPNCRCTTYLVFADVQGNFPDAKPEAKPGTRRYRSRRPT